MTERKAARAVALSWAARVSLAGVFIYAGVQKLLDPAGFALEISRYELLPEASAYVAAALPGVEVVLGASVLALPALWRRAAALGLLALMLAFTGAALTAIARDLNIDCGCFGEGGGPITWLTIVRDVALVAVCGFLVRDTRA